jgi:hypothetical protein
VYIACVLKLSIACVYMSVCPRLGAPACIGVECVCVCARVYVCLCVCARVGVECELVSEL